MGGEGERTYQASKGRRETNEIEHRSREREREREREAEEQKEER